MSMNQTNVPVRPLPDTAYYTEQPVSTGEWFWTIFVAGLPVVGLIVALVWAFGSSAKVSKRNYFRAALLWAVVGIALSVLSTIVIFAVFGSGALTGILNNAASLR